jgi:electron transport complex protein RnfB
MTAGRGAPVTVTDSCRGCGACLLTCPEHAIRPYGGILLIRDDLCTGCGECVEVCPADAIEDTDRTMDTAMDTAMATAADTAWGRAQDEVEGQ